MIYEINNFHGNISMALWLDGSVSIANALELQQSCIKPWYIV